MNDQKQYDVTDVPAIPARSWGKFSLAIEEIKALPAGKCVRFEPPLTASEYMSLRSSALYAGIRIHTRKTPEATIAWLKEVKAAPPSVANKNGASRRRAIA